MNVADLIKALQAVPNPAVTDVVMAPANRLAGALTAATGSMAATAHGLAVGDRVLLAEVVTTTGAIASAVGDVLYVITVTDANNFICSATAGGAALTGTTNGTYVAFAVDPAAVSVAAATSGGIEATDGGAVNLT